MHDPFRKFETWFAEAEGHPDIKEATAMSLATANTDGTPSVRIVLLKGHSARGFVFYTNLDSRKGNELRSTGKAALNFYWPALDRQIRIEGAVELVDAQEADDYFATRERGKQLGAWASAQSQPLATREDLEKRIDALALQYEGKDIPRPPHWSGFRLVPTLIEFWSQGQYRLHDREVFTRADAASPWAHGLLNP